jgi:outer membrane biosynthesis protein TonB
MNIYGSQWREIIFKGRNKWYGAYVLRKENTQRHLFAFFIVLNVVVILCLLLFVSRAVQQKRDANEEHIVVVTEFSDLTLEIPGPKGGSGEVLEVAVKAKQTASDETFDQTDKVSTFSSEKVSVVVSDNTPDKPKDIKKDEVNPLALYKGKQKKNDNMQDGNASVDNQGDRTFGTVGSTSSSGYGTGSGTGVGSGTGTGTGGTSFSLAGRTLKKLARPSYNSMENDVKVVVKIWVNRNGEVVRAQPGMQGTTTMDEALWETSRRAALQSKFEPDDNAPDIQTGTITYKFVRSA